MNALTREQQAGRYRAIARIEGIDPGRLEAVIKGFEHPGYAEDSRGDLIYDGRGQLISRLDAALNSMPQGEIQALIEFNDSIIRGTNTQLEMLADRAEGAEPLPAGYDSGETPRDRLLDLLDDILFELPSSPLRTYGEVRAELVR